MSVAMNRILLTNVIRPMKITRLLTFSVFVFLAVGTVAAQKPVEERNVRAAMQFLASDAMQGRGSGTPFERITAEYIGSQFMQFGLEPAGEAGWDGKPTYVQSISTARRPFEAPPTLQFGSSTVTHGKEMLVLRAGGDKLGGPLQKISLGDKPNADAAVFVKLPAQTSGNLLQVLGSVANAGASLVIVEETAQLRSGWIAAAGRQLNAVIPAAPTKPAVIIVVDTATAAAINGMADGTRIDFAGTLGEGQTWNAIGKITGTDAKLASEVIVLSAHLDHVGVQQNVAGADKIFNGADDDASGSVAVMEIARAMAAGKKPKRTVYFVCFGSEEAGGFGSRYFLNNLPFPKENFIANLQFEMIGRPDTKVKPEELWLTGYERSNLGPELAQRGAKLVIDPRPSQNFFQRSDNITFARAGIVAHTVSSFDVEVNKDYHRPTDEIRTIDFVHMTRAINSMIRPIEWLANSDFVPAWNPGKKP